MKDVALMAGGGVVADRAWRWGYDQMPSEYSPRRRGVYSGAAVATVGGLIWKFAPTWRAVGAGAVTVGVSRVVDGVLARL